MGRGPSYPWIDLEEAIAAIRKIYDYTKKAAAPTDAVVANALGYSLKSSGGVKTIAALKAYGLIEESDQNIKITDRAYRIIIDVADSPERKQAIKDAALSPKWYQTVFEKWGPDPPASTRSTLVLQHAFVPTTVDAFLNGYRQTIHFAGLSSTESLNQKQSLDSLADEGYTSKNGDYLGTKGAQSTSGGPNSALQISSNGPLASGGIKMLSETFTLPDGVTGQINWPSEITKEAYEDFVYQMEGLKRKVERAVRKVTSSSEVSSSSES